MRTNRSEYTANSALASSPDAQAQWRAIHNPMHAAPLIAAHTAAQAAVVRELIGSLGDVGFEPLED
jgi:hypothetical protein